MMKEIQQNKINKKLLIPTLPPFLGVERNCNTLSFLQ